LVKCTGGSSRRRKRWRRRRRRRRRRSYTQMMMMIGKETLGDGLSVQFALKKWVIQS
jgi:hypothetical protein